MGNANCNRVKYCWVQAASTFPARRPPYLQINIRIILNEEGLETNQVGEGPQHRWTCLLEVNKNETDVTDTVTDTVSYPQEGPHLPPPRSSSLRVDSGCKAACNSDFIFI